MLGRYLLAMVMASTLSGVALAADKNCKLEKLAELPVTMASSSPLVSAGINGVDALFLADSGAFYSVISPGSAAQFKLKEGPAPVGLGVKGIRGWQAVGVTTVNQFTLAGIPFHRVEFMVGGSELGSGAAGVLGQNVLRLADTEYDLANGAIRLMRPTCHSALPVYWGGPGQLYSVMAIDPTTAKEPHTVGVAYLNGKKLTVMFDSGAQASMMTLAAAERAGIKPDSPGVVPGGNWGGFGRRAVKTWLAPFQSFTVGDEEIRNTRLRVGDMYLDNVDMLLGVDFFLSHRIYVANSQHKLYFTYNGGPVFNLKTTAAQQTAAAQPAPDQSLDADGLARRGAAFVARHEYASALADLTRACEMAPQEPRFFFQRARAYVADSQSAPALADLDQVIELKADDVPARVLRAQLRLASHDPTGAVADLDAADHAAAQQDDARFTLAALYIRTNHLPQAIAQYDQWIDAHSQDRRTASAYGGRCWARAASGYELERALADCNKANRLGPHDAEFLQVRGLLRLRMGDFDHAISDFDASLKLNPKNPWSLWGRGQAEQHKQKSRAAQQDLAAAAALRPHIAEQFQTHGFVVPE